MWTTLTVPASYLVAYALARRMRPGAAWRSYALALLPGLAVAAAANESAYALLVWCSWAALGTAHACRGERKTAITTLNLSGRDLP